MTAQWDTRRMAETHRGSGRSPSGPVREADAPVLAFLHTLTPEHKTGTLRLLVSLMVLVAGVPFVAAVLP